MATRCWTCWIASPDDGYLSSAKALALIRSRLDRTPLRPDATLHIHVMG
jgi:hypothetical protein